jgi:hypothetical protein
MTAAADIITFEKGGAAFLAGDFFKGCFAFTSG